MVWVEQPVGTGYSQGTPNATSEADVASEFLGFFKNFVDTFGLQNRKVYITGESYAGYYVPYIADAMLNTNDTTYYGVESIMIYDPSTSTDAVQQQSKSSFHSRFYLMLMKSVPAVAYVDYFTPLFSLNASFTDFLHEQADTCGYTSFLNDYLVYPPAGPLPNPPMANDTTGECDVWDAIFEAVSLINPCFDIYQVITTFCFVVLH